MLTGSRKQPLCVSYLEKRTPNVFEASHRRNRNAEKKVGPALR